MDKKSGEGKNQGKTRTNTNEGKSEERETTVSSVLEIEIYAPPPKKRTLQT